MDIGKSFNYVFEDEKWIEKILIGGLVSLIPILGSILLLGYFVELVRNVRQHMPQPLPEWDNWGEKLAEGLKLLVIMFVWSFPLIVLYLLAFAPLAFAQDSDTGTFLTILLLCFNCLLFLYAIVVALVTPSITIRFAETGKISAGFQIGEILAFTREHVGQIILVVLVSWGVYMIAGLVGLLLCGIGLLFTAFWASAVYYHLVGQIGLPPAPVEHETQPVPSIPQPENKPELP